MSRILAIDTATEACSAALLIEGDVKESFVVAPREHNERILPMVDELLSSAGLGIKQLDAIAFGQGPGAFTGVRVAAGIVQGLAYAADLPVIGISNLAALAHYAFRVYQHEKVFTAIDARMDEIYFAAYTVNTEGKLALVIPESVISPENATGYEDMSGWVGVGSGWSYSPRIPFKPEVIYKDILPHAQDIALLGELAWKCGEAVPPEQAIPVYLRDNVAKKKQER
ncbi:tRNA (adenosine(37)-N6)-threonylcarbamoyltransferase complex dimerization subunit type 1 TsaB [Zooshikella marina]|uniref:tRNA (adenosine(37)-N6)-threonylcarbamoyltransferase complex dimerization subunit type 1 TsaB n=1 Tax=Zooshikella ganghwensis TaxID=202772 RepID=UPI001BAF47D3|nr:tRNA (adenosine(37)-N6)-threonylcarbamoyltransferase complex dimerization subunit type 1 TsaB [Zooshikella ganghwensis]MBU2705751.1 tRNA (adenosine(37)-N6)-threonylcarbamoyltransferase complex dimerization subunit type 1 TsaB [Zooshikella ganghwensis]